MTKVELHPEAKAELEDIHRWYLQRSKIAARAFISEVIHAVSLIADSPQLGTHTRDNERRLLFKRFPYSIIYRVRGEEVFITAIAHQRRRPGYWRSRI